MKKVRLRLIFLILLIYTWTPPPVEAYASLDELKAAELKDWLSLNQIKLTVYDRDPSWRFVLTCPPVDVKELEWGVLLELKGKGRSVAEVHVKPRILADWDSKTLEGWLRFEFTVSKDLLEESRILMYVEQKVPADPFAWPHSYNSIKLKDLVAAGNTAGQRQKKGPPVTQ